MSADELSVNFTASLPGFELRLSRTLPLEGVTAVFGPSGSGKSTLLRVLAGFIRPMTGRVSCGEEVWFSEADNVDLPPHRRPVGLMFQDARLFPHLNVAGNLDFAVRRQRRPGRGIQQSEVVTALDLTPLLARRIDSLSGGERQRVALGRALLTSPRLLLLDEPLAALDRERKADILPYLDQVQRGFGIPTLYVSHDVDEVAQLCDRVLVMADGSERAFGGTADIVERLDLEPLMGRFEAGVLIEGTVTGHDPRLHVTQVNVSGNVLMLPLLSHVEEGHEVRVRIRARDVALATTRPEGLSIRNVLPGRISRLIVEEEVGTAEAFVELRDAHIRSRLTLAAVEDLGLREGMPVYALIKSISFEGSAPRG
ncbi:MAG: molybdenum ABC transporter ATP-binding protein [Pseudomonadales bacterium]|nr:molybdenum ABC transporter ATP-binding protein [Pseudomonadales bacterium]NIX07422.1 molybdenum ABC transporter ATP-binding protein [Pseudomonadales bacterium]